MTTQREGSIFTRRHGVHFQPTLTYGTLTHMAKDYDTRTRWVPIEDLHLDPANPRLILGDGADETALLQKLYADEALDELFPSFVENGYFEEEPLVVVPREAGGFTVVEGNRRLATLKLLLFPDLRRAARVAGWPLLSDEARSKLTQIPCVQYKQRQDVLSFLGFRHITGARKWKPFQKARFVSQLLESGQSLDHVQTVIGDTASATKKLYQDFVVYNQLVDELGFSGDRLRDRFSLLEVMLGQRAIKTHLGISQRLPSERVDHVVPEDKLDELEEVATWVFGNDVTQPVVGESRDIGARLVPVLRNEESLAYLRTHGDLLEAYERSGGEEEFLIRKLASIERAVRDVRGILPLHADDEAIREGVRRLETLVAALARDVADQ